MINNIEFSDVIKIRKSLLVTSFIGVFYKKIVTFSSGKLKFLGFEVPVENANEISEIIAYLIVFYIIAFFIRLSKENLEESYKKHKEYKDSFVPTSQIQKQFPARERPTKERPKMPSPKKISVILWSVKFLDLYFPVAFGIIVSLWIFFC